MIEDSEEEEEEACEVRMWKKLSQTVQRIIIALAILALLVVVLLGAFATYKLIDNSMPSIRFADHPEARS